jgi:hypothetical protein
MFKHRFSTNDLQRVNKQSSIFKQGIYKILMLLAHGRWFSPGTPASSTTKTGRHDIAEILLKVALSTKNLIRSLLSVL